LAVFVLLSLKECDQPRVLSASCSLNSDICFILRPDNSVQSHRAFQKTPTIDTTTPLVPQHDDIADGSTLLARAGGAYFVDQSKRAGARRARRFWGTDYGTRANSYIIQCHIITPAAGRFRTWIDQRIWTASTCSLAVL